MDKVAIKIATPSDLEDYKRVRITALASNPESFGESLDSALSATDDEWLGRIKEDDVILAYVEGELAGMSKLSVKGGVCWLKGVFLAPAFRGQGLSDILIESVATIAALRGQTEIRLWVGRTNGRAISLYERSGYIRREDLSEPEYAEWLVMVKSL